MGDEQDRALKEQGVKNPGRRFFLRQAAIAGGAVVVAGTGYIANACGEAVKYSKPTSTAEPTKPTPEPATYIESASPEVIKGFLDSHSEYEGDKESMVGLRVQIGKQNFDSVFFKLSPEETQKSVAVEVDINGKKIISVQDAAMFSKGDDGNWQRLIGIALPQDDGRINMGWYLPDHYPTNQTDIGSVVLEKGVIGYYYPDSSSRIAFSPLATTIPNWDGSTPFDVSLTSASFKVLAELVQEPTSTPVPTLTATLAETKIITPTPVPPTNTPEKPAETSTPTNIPEAKVTVEAGEVIVSNEPLTEGESKFYQGETRRVRFLVDGKDLEFIFVLSDYIQKKVKFGSVSTDIKLWEGYGKAYLLMLEHLKKERGSINYSGIYEEGNDRSARKTVEPKNPYKVVFYNTGIPLPFRLTEGASYYAGVSPEGNMVLGNDEVGYFINNWGGDCKDRMIIYAMANAIDIMGDKNQKCLLQEVYTSGVCRNIQAGDGIWIEFRDKITAVLKDQIDAGISIIPLVSNE